MIIYLELLVGIHLLEEGSLGNSWLNLKKKKE